MGEWYRDSDSPVLARKLPFSNEVSGLSFSWHGLPFFPTLTIFQFILHSLCIFALYDHYCLHLVLSFWYFHLMFAGFVPILPLKHTANCNGTSSWSNPQIRWQQEKHNCAKKIILVFLNNLLFLHIKGSRIFGDRTDGQLLYQGSGATRLCNL